MNVAWRDKMYTRSSRSGEYSI